MDSGFATAAGVLPGKVVPEGKTEGLGVEANHGAIAPGEGAVVNLADGPSPQDREEGRGERRLGGEVASGHEMRDWIARPELPE